MISSETDYIYLEETSQIVQTGVNPMVVTFTSHPFDLRICVITTLRMYLACTRCEHGDNKALFISALRQFLEEQVCTGVDKC